MIIMILPENGGSPAYADLPVIPPDGSTIIVRRTYFGTRTFVIFGLPTITYNETNDRVDVEVTGREIER